MTDLDPTDLQAKERAQKASKEKKRLTSEREAEDFKWLMSDKRGRRVVRRLLERTGVYRTSFTGNSETFFREGERNIGLHYMAMAHAHCMDKYALMITETRDDTRDADNRSK